MAVITRAEWTKIRDRNDVKSGRTKVSIGKTLDAYHAAKTFDARIIKVKALLDAYSKYANELDMKVPGEKQLAAEIGGKLIKAAKEALDKYQDVVKGAVDLDVNDVLKSSAMMKIFPAFAKKEYSDENLAFILAVDKRVPPLKIYEEFIPTDAPRQVNLKGPTRIALEQLAKEEDYGKMNFAQARKEIAAMMTNDTVPRFAKSNEYKNLMADIAGIDD
jgi:hypothetical protein